MANKNINNILKSQDYGPHFSFAEWITAAGRYWDFRRRDWNNGSFFSLHCHFGNPFNTGMQSHPAKEQTLNIL